MRIKYNLLLLMLAFGMPAIAQQSNDVYSDENFLMSENYSEFDHNSVQLPPLAVFLDAANSYVDVKYYESKREEIEHKLKLVKKDWLNYFRLQANYQYGNNNNYLIDNSQSVGNSGVYSMEQKIWWNVGAAMTIPLSDIFSRKQRTDMVRSEISQADYEQQKTLENRQLIILEGYNEVLKHLSILKVKAEALALYDAQMKISETDFVNGRIDIISLSLERARRSAAMVSYQESKASLLNSVMLLEMLTKIRIIQK